MFVKFPYGYYPHKVEVYPYNEPKATRQKNNVLTIGTKFDILEYI